MPWLHALRKTDKAAYASCRSRIEALASFGHELRRPLADVPLADIERAAIRMKEFRGNPGAYAAEMDL